MSRNSLLALLNHDSPIFVILVDMADIISFDYGEPTAHGQYSTKIPFLISDIPCGSVKGFW
jgi:hypothetical protein